MAPRFGNSSRFSPRHPQVKALIEGIAEGSPYLWDLIRADPARLSALLYADPERYFASLLARSFAAIDAAQDEADAMRELRIMKAEAALLIALADIGGALDAATRSPVR